MEEVRTLVFIFKVLGMYNTSSFLSVILSEHSGSNNKDLNIAISWY